MQGELVPDNLRAETQAGYFGQLQWKTNDTEEYRQINIDTEPIFEDCPDMKTRHITIEELNFAIHRLKNTKTPGLDGLPSEIHKWLNEDSRNVPLKHLNECWESEPLEDSMNNANFATIYKKGRTYRPENYRPIALLNVTYKPLAITIHVRLLETIDGRISKTQLGCRKTKTPPNHSLFTDASKNCKKKQVQIFTLYFGLGKAFDKVDQQQQRTQAIKRLGTKDKITRMTEAVYKEPRLDSL